MLRRFCFLRDLSAICVGIGEIGFRRNDLKHKFRFLIISSIRDRIRLLQISLCLFDRVEFEIGVKFVTLDCC